MTIKPGIDIGRYHILEQLGEGGMAVVYKAYDTKLDCDVAIKFLRIEELAAKNIDRSLKRFQTEAKKMAQLMHPNIIRVIDYGEYNGVPYLVMPFLSGGTIKGRMGQAISWQEAAQLLKPIADALNYAHSKGLVHRDIKPSNILITETGTPMLTDFGIAKILISDETLELTSTGIGVGTPEYMSPEQAEGKNIDERADVYSLGVVFYELVTGRKPFTAYTPLAVVIKQFNDPLPNPSQFVPNLPIEVEHFLFKLLAKNPEDRFRNMDEVGKKINKFASGEVSEKDNQKIKILELKGKNLSPEKNELFYKEKRRRKVILVCLAVGLFLGIGLFSFFYIYKNEIKGILNIINVPIINQGTYLADLNPELVSIGYGDFSIGEYSFESIDDGIHIGDKITIKDKYYEHGLYAHAPSVLIYEIDGKFKRLETVVGIAGVCGGSGFRYYIEGDGKTLIESSQIYSPKYAEEISVNISGIQKIKLVFDPGTSMDCDWTIWGDPILYQ